MNIKEIVRSIKSQYQTSNPIELIHLMKFTYLITDFDLGTEGFFFNKFRKYKIILINQSLSERERFIASAHELGHVLMHENVNSYFLSKHTFLVVNKYELEADTFAAELLLDDDIFEKYYGYPLEHIALCEDVPVRYVELKYKNLN